MAEPESQAADLIPAILRRLGEVFTAHGHELFEVGGCVRDSIIGRPTKDIDLTTDARPDEIRRALALANPDSIYTVGERFGTIGAIFSGTQIEITTYRTERYTPRSRKPQIEFGSSVKGDLGRRDFTINAMARSIPAGELIDPYGGRLDLDKRIIRAVGKPDERFDEDPLRMLRAIRFCSQLHFELEEETRKSLARNAQSIRYISRERILEELNRMLLTEKPSLSIRQVVELGLAIEIMPELAALRQTSQGKRMKDVFSHTLIVLDRTPPDLTLRWSALLHDIGKPKTFHLQGGEVHFPNHEAVGETLARDVLTRLRADLKTTERVSTIVGLHMRANQYEDDWTDGAVRRLIRDSGDDFDRLLSLSMADVTSYRAQKIAAAAERVGRLRERARKIREVEDLAAIQSPLDGNELMALFNQKPGRWIGTIKDYLLDLVLEGKLRADDKATAEDIARELVESGNLD